MESKESDVGGAGGLDDTVEMGPARALAVIAVAGGAVLLGVVPASIALGADWPQLERVATELSGLAAVVGGVKLAVAAAGIAGRLWSGHTARLASAPVG